MASNGICDRVAIIGMGCTPFGDRRDASLDDLIIDAAVEASDSAGIDLGDVDAAWFGTFGSAFSGTAVAHPLKLGSVPVSRNENYCATGSDAFRNACYAVAAGAYDVVLAIGAEKMADSGQAGLPFSVPVGDGTGLEITPPGAFSYLAVAYAHEYGISADELKRALTHVAWKNHRNGARNQRAHYQVELSKERIAAAPPIAGPLSLMDCGGIGDGAAAALIVRAEDAGAYTDRPVFVKALSLATGQATGTSDPDYRFTSFPEVVTSAQDAYRQAGITDPRRQIAFAEVHDCFTITELVLMEDLGFVPRGTAWKEILAGTFDLDGDMPINPDGGLKSFGHPLGASGIRMLFECWLQLRGEAGKRQVDNGRPYAMTQNLGGNPGEGLSFVSILGSERSAP